MKTVFFQGAFDILNAGHVMALAEAAERGRLVVGLNSDELIRWYKKREPIIPFDQRKEILLALRSVDEVICCHEPMAINYLRQLDASAYCVVDEWCDQQLEAINWIKAQGGEVFVPTYYPDGGVILSSSDIRRRIAEGVA